VRQFIDKLSRVSTVKAPSKPRTGRVTANDVARVTGLSAMTVSLVINGSPRISAQTRRKVQKAIAELGYVPNRLARSLSGHRLGVLAVIVVDITHPWLAGATHAIEEEATRRGQTVIVCNHDDDPVRERAHLEKLGALRIDGVLLVACGDASADNLARVARQGLPVVLLERRVPGAAADLVRADPAKGAAMLTEHLIGHGHERVCMIAGPEAISTSRDRAAGYQGAMKAAGLAVLPVAYVEHTVEAGYEEARRRLAQRQPPAAFVGGNPYISLGIMQAIREAGVTPAEVGLVSFDDIEATSPDPFMTCCALPVRDISVTALRILEERLGGDRSPVREVVVDATINIRRSCGCDPAAAVGGSAPAALQPRRRRRARPAA
jgi:LacI family transcriptional regulator